MHHPAGQPTGTVAGDRGGSGLLQGLVGEKPVGCEIAEFGDRPATQPGGLHQHRGVVGKAIPDRGHIGQQAAIAQPVPRHLRQGGDTRVPTQIGDIGAGERQEGLTPVSMAL